MNLGELCRFWARWQPEAVAIRCDGQDVTWARLDARTDGLAAGLAKLGLGPGDRLGILGSNSVSWCEAVVAAFKLGVAGVPLNIRLAPPELAWIAGHAGCKAVAVSADLADRYDEAAAGLTGVTRLRLDDGPGVGPSIDELATTEPLAEAPEVDEAAPALIAYTSGTTGRPKGAVLTHRNLLAHITQRGVSDGWSPATRTLLCVPLAFTGGVVNNFIATYGVGGTLILERTFDPARALQLLTSEAVTVMIGVPVMWQGIAAAPGFETADLSALTTAITGGASVPMLSPFKAKGVLIRQAYALTEASGSATQLPPRLALEKPASAGVPYVHTQIRIVDEAGSPCAPGVTGEILLRGPQVMAGYWADEEATVAALAGGWLHTGDLGRLDDDGLLEVVDRKTDMIKSGGLNVYPAELERVLSDLAGVVEVAVVGVPDQRWGEVPAAILRADRPLDQDSVTAHCRAHLADYKTPRHVVLVDEPLPRSMSGKVLRRQLRDQYRHIGS